MELIDVMLVKVNIFVVGTLLLSIRLENKT